MGDMQRAGDVAREAMWIAVKISLPILAVGLAVGLIVSIFQAATQVQEASITFLPKMLALVLALALLLPWMLSVLTEFARRVFVDFSGMS